MHVSPPLKPLLISPSWPVESSANGVVSHVHQLFHDLRRLGHQPLIGTAELSTKPGAAAPSDGVFELIDGPIARWTDRMRYRLRRSTAVDCIMARRIRALVTSLHRNRRIDLIQIEEAWGTAAHLAGRLPVPVNVRLHGPWFLTGAADGVPQDATFRRRVQLEGRGIAAAAEVSAPSNFVLEATRNFYQIPLERAHVVPNCVRLVPGELQWSGEASPQPVILFVGRFDAIKGGDLVLRAFSQVYDRLPEARLVFIGPDRGIRVENGRMQHFAEFTANNLSQKCAERVAYLGSQTPSVIEEWRRRASVTVIASRFESFGLTALEAVAHGCATVAAAVGGIPEIIHDEVTGLLVPPESPEALSAAICRLLENHALAVQLGRAASDDSRTRFEPARCAELMVATYAQTVSETGAARRQSA